MASIVITVEDYYYRCGDGCCSEWGEDVTVEVDGEITEEVRMGGFDTQAAEIALKAAGYAVSTTYDIDVDAEILTAIKEE